MRAILKAGFFFVSILSHSALAAPAPVAAPADGADKIQVLSASYGLLSLERPTPLSTPEKTLFLQTLAKLKGLTHPITTRPTGPKIDGAMQFVNPNLPQSLIAIEALVQKNAFPQALASLRRTLQLCSECHADSTQPAWNKLTPRPGFSLIEVADFHKNAGRSNDALLHYEKILTTKGTASTWPDAWEKSALNIVALGIKSGGNAYTYVDVLSNLLQETVISKKQRELVSSWRAQGKAWGLEKQPPSRPTELLAHARAMNATADSNNRITQGSGLVSQSRAMLGLRKVGIYGSADQKGKAFLMAGELREKMILPGIWLNPEDYYEACIRA
ncbi:MAG: hypothetical protein EOP10_29285, partial [Proteobacteria bacterium]